jgi:MYXO-CTERM domain-containing protein
MSAIALLLIAGSAWATPRAVGVDGGALPREGVVRVAFEGVPASLVTVDDGGEPYSLLQARCTTAKDGDTELCTFTFPDDVPDGVLALEADALSTTLEVGTEVDAGAWSGTVEQLSATVSQRDDPDIGEVVVDVDSSWQAPAAPAAGYILEIRDETSRAVDWRTIPLDGPSTLLVKTASEVLVSRGEICLQAVVFDPYDEEVWSGNRICEDMPKQPDPACRGCSTRGPAAPGGLALLLVLGLVRRRSERR